MKSRRFIPLIIAINMLVFGIFIFHYTYIDYPLIGHDFRLFLSRLLDTHLHYIVEGLSIQWYTPSFGGGLPAYANPLQAQFSLPQFLLFVVDPLNAVLISSIIYAFFGFIAVFIFMKDGLQISKFSSILGGVFFIANGFFIERVVIGHVNFITFPLISIYLLAFLHPKLPPWISALMIAIISSVLIYSGGVYIGVIGLFSILLLLPIIYLLKPTLFSSRRLLMILFMGGIFTLLISGSKLNATSVYMANFPREVKDEYSVNWMTGVGGLIFQLIGVMSTLPILTILGKSPMVFIGRLTQWTGTPYSFWELDTSLSPVLIIILAFGVFQVLRYKPIISFSWKKFVATLLLIFTIILVVQFSIAKGELFETLRSLPFIRSLHANTRFSASFILPLAILAACVFDKWVFSRLNRKRQLSAFLGINLLTLIFLFSYYLLPTETQARFCPGKIFTKTYQQIQSGNYMPVQEIIPDMNDYEVFLANASNTIYHYEPLFLDENKDFHPEVIQGSVFELIDGYYNMTNPTGYLFPEENGTVIYHRFIESEYEIMVEFLSRHQPNWEISPVQKILNWTALVSCLLGILGLIVYLIKKVFTSIKNKKHPVIDLSNPR